MLLAVCDGLGGHRAGEEASRIAAAALAATLPALPFSGSSLLTAIYETHALVRRAAEARPEWQGMATTLTCAWLAGDTCVWGQVGDSRLYLLRAGQLAQITPEHSLVGRLRRAGEITEEEARQHPLHASIDQCLGSDDGPFAPEIGEFSLSRGDVLLLCTDGLVDGLPDAEIRARLLELPSRGALDAAVRHVVRDAVERCGRDNTTAVLARVGSPDTHRGLARSLLDRARSFAGSPEAARSVFTCQAGLRPAS